MEPLDYCADKVALPGTPGYYAVLFQPPAVRNALLALRALQRELADVAEQCSEREIAQRKLLYWQQELQHLHSDAPDPPSAHPVRRALARHAPDALNREAVQRLIDATARRISLEQLRSDDELDQLCADSAGTIAQACAQIADSVATDDTPLAAVEVALAGERLRLLSLPRRAGLPAHSGVALSTLTRASVTPAQVDRGGADPALVQLRRDLLAGVFAALARADKVRPQRRGYTATCLRLTRCLARANQRGSYEQTGQLIHVAPLRLLWHAWRARQPAS